MAKIQLTIKTSYLPTWGAYEGIRELLQNGRDAEVEHSAPMRVDWRKESLHIENDGTTLPLKALLLGHTTKEGNSQLIGKFGEGLKLGILALVRAGHPIKIRNGAEVWTPSIERSDLFDDNVLTFNIERGREPKNRVRVEIGGVTNEAWETMRECFLFLNKPKKSDIIETYNGDLLLGPKYKGRIYVKGIFVQTDPDLAFGYNLPDAQLDRDRKMVESWNLKYHTRSVFMAALNQHEDLFEQFNEMLENPTTEIETISDTYMVPEKASQDVAAKFRAKHGENAIPVTSLSESVDIEHLGKKGVVVPKQLGVVLAKTLGDTLLVKQRLAKEETKRFGWGDLSEEERSNLSEAVSMINEVEPLSLDAVEVVEFRSEGLMGQFKDGKVFLAKKYLTDLDETLRILVHEIAHKEGLDGEKAHVNRLENIWKGIVRNLRARS